MKIAVFSGPLLDYSAREAMELAAGSGYAGIELACREPHLSPATSVPRVREMKRIADHYGLAIPALGGYAGRFSESGDDECRREFEDFCRLLEHAGRLEADMVRIFQGGPNAFLAADYHYEKAAYWLRRCAAEARKHGKRIVLEIHNVSLIETADSALRLLDMVGEERVGLIHDAANMYIADTDYGRESVKRLGRRLFHVHVKDIKRIERAGGPGTFRNVTRHGEEAFRQCLLGEGEVDHSGLIAGLRETGYDGWMTLECFAPVPPEEQIVHDLAVLRRWLGLA